MDDDDAKAPFLSLTAEGVEFAPWVTGLENDDLLLGRVSFDAQPSATFLRKGFTIALPAVAPAQHHPLEATFVSVEKRAVYRFGFHDPLAFRVLDENGLLELWNASAATPRPGLATFRARGHRWADESPLVFLAEENQPRFSYFIATDGLCLEVVCDETPYLSRVGPALVTNM